jgi:phosphomannomutase
MADDPDPVDRAELAALLDRASPTGEDSQAGAADEAEGAAQDLIELAAAGDAEEAASQLDDRFAGRLGFRAAGLRGPIGAGPNRMNRAVVRATTGAVAGWLRASATPAATTGPADSGPARDGPTANGPASSAPSGDGPAGAVSPLSVVIGCDARHRSDEFASEAAQVLAAAGVRAHLLPRPCPRPLVAFAVRWLAASAGIMITAGRDPRTDNGYTLFAGDGALVTGPAAAEIDGRIGRLGPLRDIPVAALDGPGITRLGGEVADAYLSAITSEARPAGAAVPDEMADGPGKAPDLAVVYTPMHGVAGSLLLQAVQRAGLPRPHVVTAQRQPDPDFPTAAFPNPEEPVTLVLALADAKALDADLVLANDPDGDRLAVAVPEPETRRKIRNVPGTSLPEDGRWRVLSGDQVGALLGDYLLTRAGAAAAGRGPLVAASIASSTLLSKIAARAGAQYAETPCGFEWIARAADQVPGATFRFGYEEAIGYAVGDVVRDKDGIGAAVAFLRLATDAARAGRSVLDLYDDLEREHGVHLTSRLSVRVPVAGRVMRRLRAAPPASLAGRPVGPMTDYRLTRPGAGGPGGPPASDVLSFPVGGDRVVIRPSGTEPRVNAYLEIVEQVQPGGLIAARLAAQRRLTPLREAVHALLNGMATISGQRAV